MLAKTQGSPASKPSAARSNRDYIVPNKAGVWPWHSVRAQVRSTAAKSVVIPGHEFCDELMKPFVALSIRH